MLFSILAIACSNDTQTKGFDSSCPLDLTNDRQVSILDVTSFIAPIRRLETAPGHPNYDVRWDVVPGPGDLGTIDPPYNWINIQDLIHVMLNFSWCDTQVRYMSKMLDFDAQWDANPTAGAAMMNTNYEAINTFDCGICREYGNAFNGTTYVYQDSTKICGLNDEFCTPECEGEQPGTDCSDILQASSGVCYQNGFGPDDNSQRYLADVTQADVQNEIIAKLQALVAESAFDGIYIDVAEAYLPHASDCQGTPVVSNADWLAAWATLAERMQNEVDGPLILNSQYTTWNSLKALDGTNADRFWAAPDAVEIEFGWIQCRHGCNTVSGAEDYLAYLDRLHGLGTAVLDFERRADNSYTDYTAAQDEFGLAMYLIARESGDFYSTPSHDGQGSAFSTLWSSDYGEPLGPRSSCGSGCYQRDYENGTIQANVVTKIGVLP